MTSDKYCIFCISIIKSLKDLQQFDQVMIVMQENRVVIREPKNLLFQF